MLRQPNEGKNINTCEGNRWEARANHMKGIRNRPHDRDRHTTGHNPNKFNPIQDGHHF